MIIKERSLYRKLLDWHKKTFGIGFWDAGDSGDGISTGTGIIVFLIFILLYYSEGVWLPILENIVNDLTTYFS